MNRIAFAIPLVFAAAVANAQESATPVVETGLNYSFTTMYPGSGVPSFTSMWVDAISPRLTPSRQPAQ